jgi:sugar/nucleoside kinase (ribokinase family)
MNLPLGLGASPATSDVVAVGESSLDYVGVIDTWPVPDRKLPLADFATLAGGQAATGAVACARLGWRARYVGCIGDDDAAGTIVQALIRDGVEAQLVRRAGSRSRVAMILVDSHTGARTVL